MPFLREHLFPVGWLLAAWVAIIGPLTAQEKPVAAPEPEEAEVLAAGGKELAAYATLCFKNGFPKRAREVWLEVLGEYAPDDEPVRKALGFVRLGTTWQRDPKFEYPEHDEPNVTVARMLEGKWTPLAGKLGEAHRALSAQLATAGKQARATYHSQRALRFLPNDKKVVATAGLQQYEGITGDEVDLGILRRSRLMDRAITKLTELKVETAEFADKNAMLDKGGMAYSGWKTEHFTVWGDYDPAVLQEAASWAERALQFCDEAFAGYPEFPSRHRQIRKMAFFKEKATWVKLIEAHADLIGRENLEFVTKNAASTLLKDIHTAGPDGPQIVFDLAVRWVAQDYVGLSTDGMEEGIGHAVVAMFFGRNLVFMVGQQKQEGTVAGNQRDDQRLQLPDLDTWRDLATEAAWSKGTTPAARLPLLKAASFPTDGRIKAWSFCDYLLRRDPRLLRHLDASASKARNEADVAADFRERAKEILPGKGIEDLEAGWRRFWTEDSAMKAAILQKKTPLESASKEAPAWLEHFNRAREQFGGAPVGWSAQLSTDCKQHADYLKANKDLRGPEHEHTQQSGKPGYSNAGRSFAQMALVWSLDKDPKKAMEAWLLLPGFRDAILNKNIDTVGIYCEGGLVVLDCARGRAPAATNSMRSALYPAANQKGGRQKDPVPSAVDVDLLGPECKKLLRDNQRDKQKQVGLPLTVHFYNNRDDVACTVTAQGAPLAGWLVRGNGTIRRTSAPGMWVFYPAEPLPKGVDIKASWTWPGGKHDVTFVAN